MTGTHRVDFYSKRPSILWLHNSSMESTKEPSCGPCTYPGCRWPRLPLSRVCYHSYVCRKPVHDLYRIEFGEMHNLQEARVAYCGYCYTYWADGGPRDDLASPAREIFALLPSLPAYEPGRPRTRAVNWDGVPRPADPDSESPDNNSSTTSPPDANDDMVDIPYHPQLDYPPTECEEVPLQWVRGEIR